MSLGPLDLPGGPFLQLYGMLLAITVVAGLIIPRWLRPEGRTPRNTDTDELAYLAGGKARYGDAVVSRMLAKNLLVIDTGDKFLAAGLAGDTPVERSVMALSQPAKWRAIEHVVGRHADGVRSRLVADDLLTDAATALQMRFWQTLPYFLLIGFGIAKLMVGEARHRPVGFLTLLLVLTAVLALIRFVAVDRRTRTGIAVLEEARQRADRIRRAPASGETDLAVALFGTMVLAGSGWEGFHRMRTASTGGDSGTSSSSDGGGGSSGCGGEGCGGCGS
jgi:uncharacterized protein (TIGR04222 family)